MTKAISNNPHSHKTHVSQRKKIVKKSPFTHKIKDEETKNAISPITSSQNEVKTSAALARAHEIQANLPPQFPSYVKVMLKSHVSGGYWLGLQRQFCISCLPNKNVDVVLVDEDGTRYNNVYLAHKNGFSGGWRGFAIDKKLQVDDVVIFQCVEPCKFKVYIVRANTVPHTQPMDTDRAGASKKICKTEKKENEEPRAGGSKNICRTVKKENEEPQAGGSKDVCITVKKENEEPPLLDSWSMERTLKLIADYDPATDQFDTESHDWDDLKPDSDMGGFSQCVVNFSDVKKFEDFTIQVDGLNLDSEIPTHLRRKYFKLCSSRNMYLHENLAKGLSHNTATGIISDMIKMADAIRDVKSTKRSVTHLENWDRILKSFEGLGMGVGFLRDRVSKLVDLYRESQSVINLRSEMDEAENEMRFLEDKLHIVRAQLKMLNLKINNLLAENEKFDSEWIKVARAPF